MRIVSDKPSELHLECNLSNSTLVLYYRPPTAAEHAQYANGMTRRQGRKIINCTGECRQKFGAAILEGFRDGDFGEEKNGKLVPVSSNPESKGFREDWKAWFRRHNPDLVERLAIVVFELPVQIAEGDPDRDQGRDEDRDQGGAEDTDPN